MRLRRTAAVAAAVTVTAVTLPGPLTAPAHAAPLGSITVTPATGSVDTDPMFATATASATCPANYGTNAGLRIARAGTSQFANLTRVGDDADYDAVPPTLRPNRSMRAAFGTTPITDGDYTLVIVCTGESAGDHPDVFSTTIRVAGTTWTAGGGGPGPTTGPTTGPTGGPGGSGNKQTLNMQVDPAATSASPSPTGTPGGGLPRTGSAVARTAAIGLGLVAAGVLIVRLVRRRRLA
ncbi:hypothetical protein [Dactylosporangium sp. NPDC050588]|uniref:hypothetical protein n=1 Tax=Dactylosporangium sp. NPDC050588 TaxID=3157211 RepID=UPI0033C54FAC